MAKSKDNDKEIPQGGQTISTGAARNYGRKLKLRPYQLVFDPTPKQRYHKLLIALIPPLGHELDCPLEFEQFPYAKYEWLRVMELNKKIHTITPAHRELLYGYCLMVERRKRCMLEWDGDEKYNECVDENGKRSGRIDYLGYEIDRLTTDIYKVGKELGIYPKVQKPKGKGGSNDDSTGDSQEIDFDYDYEIDESEETAITTDDLFD